MPSAQFEEIMKKAHLNILSGPCSAINDQPKCRPNVGKKKMKKKRRSPSWKQLNWKLGREKVASPLYFTNQPPFWRKKETIAILSAGSHGEIKGWKSATWIVEFLQLAILPNAQNQKPPIRRHQILGWGILREQWQPKNTHTFTHSECSSSFILFLWFWSSCPWISFGFGFSTFYFSLSFLSLSLCLCFCHLSL